MKKILVMPVKNEDWILEKTLSCASLWADHIIVADQNSTDRTVEILKQFPKVAVIKNDSEFHSSNVRKKLLEAARDFEGQNAIFSFDADEIPTSHILGQDFLEKLHSLAPGMSLQMEWINLWRSPRQYRVDRGSMYAPAHKHFAFIDDRKVTYTTLNVINDHTSRIPLATQENSVKLDVPKVLHYQFSNWDRTVSKQAYYRVTEFLQRKKDWLTILKINLKYFATKDERGLELAGVPEEWLKGYLLDIDSFEKKTLSWYDMELAAYFNKYGPSYFSWLDIWDAGLVRKLVEIGLTGHKNRQAKGLDVRSLFQKAYHMSLYILFRLYNGFKLIQRKVS